MKDLSININKYLFPVASSLIFIFLISLYFFPDYQLLFIPLILFFYFFLIIRPDLYLPFVILMYLIVVGEISPVLRLFVHIIGFSSILIFILFRRQYLTNVYSQIDHSLKKFLIFFFAIIFISSVFSEMPVKGFEIILKEIYFFLIVFAIYLYISTRKNYYPVLIALMISGLVMSGSSIYNILNVNIIDFIITGSSEFRTGGLLSNVNALSGFIVVVMPFFIAFYLLSENFLIRILIGSLIFILFLGVLATISRSAGLAIIIGFLFFLFHYNRKVFFNTIAILLILIIFFNLLPVSESLFGALRLQSGFSQRDLLWQLSIDMFKDNWLLGIGPGLWGANMFNYSPVLQDSYIGYLFYDVNIRTEGFNNSHNYYLVFLSDMGIAGLFLALYLPFVLFRMAFQNLRISKKINKKDFLINLAITSVLVSMFLRAFFEGISIITFGWVAVDLPFWIVVAILLYYNFVFKNNSVIKEGFS